MNIRLITPFIATLLLLSGCDHQSGSYAYQQGNMAFEQGKYKTSLRHYLYAANRDLPEAQYAVGYQYYYGLGTEANIFKSMYWFKQAAPQSKRAEYAVQQILAHREPLPWTIGLHWK